MTTLNNTSSVPAVGDEKTFFQKYNKVLYMIALSLFALFWMLPIIWTLTTSFRPEISIQADLARFFPDPFTTENWEYVLRSSKIPRWLFNSAFVAVTHTALQLIVCSTAAYAFARIPFKGRGIVYPLVLAGLMVPGQATFIPVYLMFSNLGLLNTYTALILPGIASPFAIFLLTQFFKEIPIEFEEAAYIDGASRLTIFRKIILPLSLPALTTLAIFTFLGNWNDYLWPLVAATKDEVRTITIGLKLISSQWGYADSYGKVMAAAWVGAMPIVLFFFAFQRRILSGISFNSGIK
ncbi:carbohydrate ABC transporter permease [Phototrophicus methaneseepsis]|uniref:Carbohydrate ABC transporter permease n=1 Tax=Phototrophicus methaneseepsis TaxID=2710758 RepID=A0A7S8EAT2_9CHLR|nr:carbohydrate ABC transporter permease [Phototrophicus methaneseepsis]QPC83393.1 carbohydrate ABC transporter permease [Phototrophicus methaneseepsis]